MLDNHYVRGGQGDVIASALGELALQPAVHLTAIGVTELPVLRSQRRVSRYHRLDVDGLERQFSAQFAASSDRR